jgi:phosphonate transport system permease protein
MDENYQAVPGTEIVVRGKGFRPDTETELWWVDPLENAFRMRKEGEYVFVVTDASGGFELTLNMPYAVVPRQEGKQDIHRIEARQISTVGRLEPSEALLLVIGRMVETIFMGMMATLFGIVLSIPVSFLASRNLMAHSPITLAIYYLTAYDALVLVYGGKEYHLSGDRAFLENVRSRVLKGRAGVADSSE